MDNVKFLSTRLATPPGRAERMTWRTNSETKTLDTYANMCKGELDRLHLAEPPWLKWLRTNHLPDCDTTVCARLTNGATVELPKECTCLTHNGPHWLYTDHFDRAKNLWEFVGGAEWKDEYDQARMLKALAEREIPRLADLAYYMRIHGIEKIIYNSKSAQ